VPPLSFCVKTITQPDLDDFINLSWLINQADPRWIPPIRARLQQELTGADAFGKYGRLQLFGCESNGKLTGRLAAIVNPRLLDSDGHPVGQVGYFEAIDDVEVAGVLFDSAFAWLRAEGARQVWGPMNGGAHRTHRFMTAGFDQDPFLFEPRNPPYYPRLFQHHGFAPVHTWYSIDTTSAHLKQALSELRLLRVRKGTLERYELVRSDPADAATVLQQLYGLLDGMWTGHTGYASLEFPEFVEVFGPALSLMRVGSILQAVDRTTGRVVGCGFSFPDYADEVRALNGDASAWGAWLHNRALPRRVVLHTVGLTPEARGTGVVGWLTREMLQYCADNYQEGVMAVIVQEWGALQKVAPATRAYALYARQLD
jgi:hypothetical protein